MSSIRAWVRNRRAAVDQRGIAAVWMVITLFVLLGIAAFAVDLVHALVVQQKVQNAADAAALGGVVKLPGDPAAAIAQAKLVAADNGYPDGVGGVVVTVTPDVANSKLNVQITTPTETFFGKALGVDQLHVKQGSTAQFDPPQQLVSKLDVVFVIDRTQSMSDGDMEDARTAARKFLESLDPSLDHVALGLLGPSGPNSCPGGGNGVPANTSAQYASGNWIVAPTFGFSSNYQDGSGNLNGGDPIVQTVNCFSTSGVGTNLSTPMAAAQAYLQTNGRPDAKWAIILETDGQPHNSGYGTPASHTCQAASSAATTAKLNPNIVVQTIGFGLDGANNVFCEDASGAWHNQRVRTLLANMASPFNGVPAADNGCDDAENTDGDGFFCVPKNGDPEDLADVFVKAGQQVGVKRDPRLVG